MLDNIEMGVLQKFKFSFCLFSCLFKLEILYVNKNILQKPRNKLADRYRFE